MAEVLEEYAGTYDLQPAGKLVVIRSGKHLLAKLAQQPAIKIYPKSETNFFLHQYQTPIRQGKIQLLVVMRMLRRPRIDDQE